VDESIPKDIESYKKLVNLIVDDHLKKGKNVIVHCLGGLGRAGTFSAACLIRDNLNAK
jgi:protein-tyrosine phosphatase